ncbi:MAG: GNAT family N-acetyltransferase [Spirochaetales bacterium]|nr:GNAT family N-acetyltransferase [Spirochaetales bacterium]
MVNLEIRRATEKDVDDFVDLYLIHSNYYFSLIFGKHKRKLLKDIFPKRRHFFSYENTLIAEVDGKVAGMALFNLPEKKDEEKLRSHKFIASNMSWRILFTLFPMLKSSLKGKFFLFDDEDFYLQSVAVYPEYQGLDIDNKLLEALEDYAKSKELKRAVITTEQRNEDLQKVLENNGFIKDSYIKKFKLRGQEFSYTKMVKVF